MTAFGHIATGIEAHDIMEAFTGWLRKDARSYGEWELREQWDKFCELFICCNCGETLMEQPLKDQVCIACLEEKKTKR